jgi:hypothetical protein
MALRCSAYHAAFGDRTILSRITKVGTAICACSSSKGARAIQHHPASWLKHSFGPLARGCSTALAPQHF